MIASHDSFTFMRARFRIMELVAFMWRTQTKNIREQREAGVSHLDIRIRWIRKGKLKGRWRVCHGLVDFNLTFTSIEEIAGMYRNFSLRIILERGRTEEFEGLAQNPTLWNKYPNIKFLGIKKGWKVFLSREVPVIDLCFTPFLSSEGLFGNLKRILRMFREDRGQLSISGWARRHQIPDSGKEENDRLYFADRI